MSTAYMKCRTLELEIPEGNPFQNDKLDRSHLGNILTDIVKFYGQSGCVMALNGEWGAGKTTFVKMWGQKLKNDGFKTAHLQNPVCLPKDECEPIEKELYVNNAS